jgi:predicted CxxxxCH...CXXCH cytochrome family protein
MSDWRVARFVLRGAAVALWIAAAATGCLNRRDETAAPAPNPCTRCHGDAKRPGEPLTQAAPPTDLAGHSDPSFRGVGAHQIHLNASPTHAPIACQQCHVVPQHVGDAGHADHKAPAVITFGDIATSGGRSPSYDPATRHCSDTYCHRDSDEVWNQPRDSAKACGTCHTLPPPAPHVQAQNCYACHKDVIDKDRNFINPALHVDGKVEVKVACNNCHGSDKNNAPPKDTQGNTDPTSPAVGAHQIHLAGGNAGRPLECTECHVVPKNVTDPGHIDHPLPATVIISGVGTSKDRNPTWDHNERRCADTWCHGPVAPQPSPVWNSNVDLTCTSCHGTPPPPPHPQMTRCSHCHGDVVNDDNKTIKNRSLHVNGEINVIDVTAQGCTFCHGSSQNPDFAPPPDTSGNTATTFPGVGAHQSHLKASSWHRPVQCSECHIVPTNWADPGHIDTPLPAELTFSGVALTWGAQPSFDGTRCTNTYCHGDYWGPDRQSGGSITEPVWTQVDGTQVVCGSCHGLPPPSAPDGQHPSTTAACNTCHTNLDASMNFIDPSLHIDGVVE